MQSCRYKLPSNGPWGPKKLYRQHWTPFKTLRDNYRVSPGLSLKVLKVPKQKHSLNEKTEEQRCQHTEYKFGPLFFVAEQKKTPPASPTPVTPSAPPKKNTAEPKSSTKRTKKRWNAVKRSVIRGRIISQIYGCAICHVLLKTDKFVIRKYPSLYFITVTLMKKTGLQHTNKERVSGSCPLFRQLDCWWLRL